MERREIGDTGELVKGEWLVEVPVNVLEHAVHSTGVLGAAVLPCHRDVASVHEALLKYVRARSNANVTAATPPRNRRVRRRRS